MRRLSRGLSPATTSVDDTSPAASETHEAEAATDGPSISSSVDTEGAAVSGRRLSGQVVIGVEEEP